MASTFDDELRELGELARVMKSLGIRAYKYQGRDILLQDPNIEDFADELKKAKEDEALLHEELPFLSAG